MIEFYLGKNKYSIKNSYNELTPNEFIYLSEILLLYNQAKITFRDVKVMMAVKLLGIKPRRVQKEQNRFTMSENVYHVSNLVNFYFNIKYRNQTAFDSLSPEMQQILMKTLPEDVSSHPEARAMSRIERWYEVDPVIAKNLVPGIKAGSHKLTGYIFNIMDNMLVTSLTAARFIDACEVMRQVRENNSPNLLPLLAAILYMPSPYNYEKAMEQLPSFIKVSESTLNAIHFNFNGICAFIATRTRYSVLFKRKNATKIKDTDIHGSIYSLAKTGYGNTAEIENMNLFKYLDLLIKEMKDAVNAMQNAGKKPDEIATALKMNIELVTRYIND